MKKTFNKSRLDAIYAYKDRMSFYKDLNYEELYRLQVEKLQLKLSFYYFMTRIKDNIFLLKEDK